jgi:hypothetical protein
MDWQQHEKDIARLYSGKRVSGSGSKAREKGDVRVEDDSELFECKYTSSEKKATIVKRIEKVAKEAYEEGYDPVLALRYYDPDSPLARDGHVDLIVRLAHDDVRRSEELRGD